MCRRIHQARRRRRTEAKAAKDQVPGSPHWSVDITEIQGSGSTAEWQDVPRCAKCQLEGTRYMELRGLNGWI